MTHDEYWNGPANLPRVYRKAEELRREKVNSQLWIQGMYIYEALCDASPLFRSFGKGKVTAHPYAKEPYDIYGTKARKTAKRTKRKTEKDNMEKGLAYMHKFMAAFNNRIKGGDKSADN